jgi:hypothetical protein
MFRDRHDKWFQTEYNSGERAGECAHSSGVGLGGPASERVGESEGEAPSE